MSIAFVLADHYGSVNALSGYNYRAKITISNTCTDNYDDRILFELNAKSLVDLGWIQPDADDVALATTGDSQLKMTSKDLSIDSSVWLLDYIEIPALSSTTEWLWLGNPTMTSDQVWVASGSDTIAISDHNDLDLEKDFMLNATVTVIGTPPGSGIKFPIIDKVPASGTPTGYGLYLVSGTPTFRFEIYGSGTEAAVSIDAVIGTEYDLSAFYDGTNVVISGIGQASTIMSGSVTTNSEDVSICEFDGYCDDIAIRIN